MDYLSIVFSLAAVLVAIYYFTTRNHNLFKKHGIVHVPPTPLFGNMGSFVSRQTTMMDLVDKIYQLDPKAKYVGFYEFLTPIIVLRDLDLIKTVTMKNVEQFPDHRPQINRKVDPMLGGTLFMLNGDQWKDHRSMLSPTFTSSKIKTMFKLMSECATRFAEHLSNLPDEQHEMEVKDLLTKYTNDVIASCVYNAAVDSIKEPNNVFYVYGRICTSVATFKKSLMLVIHRNAPWLAELLQLKFVDSHIDKFFYDQVRETVETRQRTGAHRSDILQLFMDNNKKREPGKEMTVQHMASHAFSFFFGGFDSVSSQTSIVAHLLAENPDGIRSGKSAAGDRRDVGKQQWRVDLRCDAQHEVPGRSDQRNLTTLSNCLVHGQVVRQRFRTAAGATRRQTIHRQGRDEHLDSLQCDPP